MTAALDTQALAPELQAIHTSARAQGLTYAGGVPPALAWQLVQANRALLVDVRSAGEFAAANAPGTVNIPLGDLGNRLSDIPKTAPVVVGCASGTRSGMAKLMLKKNGYTEVYNIGAWTKFL